MVNFQWAVKAACFAALGYGTLLGLYLQVSFGIVTFWTQNVLANEAI